MRSSATRTEARSLVIAPQWIGDAVMTEPLMLRLHRRGERLSVGALPWVAPVYRAMPQVAEVIEFPFQHGGLQWKARRAWASQLRGRFDNAYVLPNSAKSALLPFLAGIRRRVGYHGEMRYGLLTQRLPNPPRDERPPMVGFYSALAGERGTEADRPRLLLPPAQIDAVLQAHGLSRRGFHVFAPGAEFGSSKRWPPQHYAELAAGLTLPVLLLGSGKEHALCEQIALAAPGRCTNLAGKTALLDAFGLIAAAHSVVSNDSGLMHVAAAFGTPQVAVYGSTSPEHTPPLSGAATVLWLKRDAAYQPPLDCAPCFQRECPLGHNRCMVDIQPARVAEVLATIA